MCNMYKTCAQHLSTQQKKRFMGAYSKYLFMKYDLLKTLSHHFVPYFPCTVLNSKVNLRLNMTLKSDTE